MKICCIFALPNRDVAQLVACVVRDDEAAGSSPVIPTFRHFSSAGRAAHS